MSSTSAACSSWWMPWWVLAGPEQLFSSCCCCMWLCDPISLDGSLQRTACAAWRALRNPKRLGTPAWLCTAACLQCRGFCGQLCALTTVAATLLLAHVQTQPLLVVTAASSRHVA